MRESGRAKRLSIKVFPRGRVEVVVPKRTKAADVREFVEAHKDWIRDAREKFAADHPPEPFALPKSIRLDGIERQFDVVYEPQYGTKTVKYRSSGHKVSHANKKTKRVWKPNLQRVRARVGRATRHLIVCTRCLRSGRVAKAG